MHLNLFDEFQTKGDTLWTDKTKDPYSAHVATLSCKINWQSDVLPLIVERDNSIESTAFLAKQVRTSHEHEFTAHDTQMERRVFERQVRESTHERGKLTRSQLDVSRLINY